jgi:hypothetical protein
MGRLTAAGACIAFALLAAAAPASAAADTSGFEASAPVAALGRAEAQRVWTPARIAAAPPLRITPGGALRTGPRKPAAGPLEARAARSEGPVGARRYPNRVHGKLVGHFPRLGDFACSATVVSSRSGSLLTSAGHCAYDQLTGITASRLAFAPGYSRGSLPYGVWPVRNLIVPGGWARAGSPDYDFSMLRTVRRGGRTLEQRVGSRGIGFGQPVRLRAEAYGYPAAGRRSYDGRKLIRCAGHTFPDPASFGGPRGRGMRCDQAEGASGGGWVAQHSFVVSNTSHGYPRRPGSFFGPTYGRTAQKMYAAHIRGWPSAGPIRCGGSVATIVGTNRGERIRGTKGSDVIATIGGDDRVAGRGGDDRICTGNGSDRIRGGGGRDRIDGGPDRDRCGPRRGNRLRRCERG